MDAGRPHTRDQCHQDRKQKAHCRIVRPQSPPLEGILGTTTASATPNEACRGTRAGRASGFAVTFASSSNTLGVYRSHDTHDRLDAPLHAASYWTRSSSSIILSISVSPSLKYRPHGPSTSRAIGVS